MENPLNPGPSLLAKVGSIVVHVDEMLSNDGHWMDRAALDALIKDPDVKEWLELMSEYALVPRKRKL